MSLYFHFLLIGKQDNKSAQLSIAISWNSVDVAKTIFEKAKKEADEMTGGTATVFSSFINSY